MSANAHSKVVFQTAYDDARAFAREPNRSLTTSFGAGTDTAAGGEAAAADGSRGKGVKRWSVSGHVARDPCAGTTRRLTNSLKIAGRGEIKPVTIGANLVEKGASSELLP